MIDGKIYKIIHCNRSLLNKVPRVPWVPQCLVPKCLLSAQVPKCPSAQVSKRPGCPSAQVPFECLSALSTQVPKCLECQVPKSLECLECLECPSAQVPFECRVPKCPSAHRVPRVSSLLIASVVRVLECLECLWCQSASVNQLVIQQFSQLA